MRRLAASAQLILIAALAVACASDTKRMTTLPGGAAASAPKDGRGAVVLFRVAVASDDKPGQATLSSVPRFKWHLLVNVGPPGDPLSTGKAFAAGQLDPAARDAGWGFLTLPPGMYQLAFSAYRTHFTLPGAQNSALGFGQTSASRVEVPADTELLYIGTFDFTCHKITRFTAYFEHECTTLELLDEEKLAREVAAASLSRFGALRTALASTPQPEVAR